MATYWTIQRSQKPAIRERIFEIQDLIRDLPTDTWEDIQKTSSILTLVHDKLEETRRALCRHAGSPGT